MAKKLLIPLCLLLALIFSVQAAAATAVPQTFKEDKITFSEYTDGADAAFDGDKETGFGGSITGMFENRSVLMGVTIRANSTIKNLTVKGSENGVDWIELYYQKSVATIAMFGSNGSGTITDIMCDNMYTYSFKYLRFEMEYGSISEITMYGYATCVDGYISELDTSFGTNGYETSGSYYTDYARMPYTVDHIIHSASKGEVVSYQFLDAAQSQKYAYITLKAKGNAPITEIALMHKDDKNVIRWDSVRVEVSADGEAWVDVMTIPSDFSSQHNLRSRTLMMIDVPENDSYVYARISSTRGSISICVMDLYTRAEAVSVPANVLKGWESDPFIASEAPKETEKIEETTAVTEAVTETSDTVSDENGGCGGSVAAAVIPITVFCTTTAALVRKRRRN